MNFENLVLGKVFYSYILDIVFGIYIVVLILYIICRYAKKELVDAVSDFMSCHQIAHIS